MNNRLTAEAFIIFLLGGVPLIASYLLGGANNLQIMTKVLVTNNNFLNYYIISLFVASLLTGWLSWLIWKPTDSTRETWKIITTILTEAGSGALGIIRVAAGVLLTFPSMWLFLEPDSFMLEKAAPLIIYGIIAFGECVIISGWQKTIQRRARINL
ncbi:hypothetical protein [Pseudomonas sp. RL]|uniref:hypothetical protein n=1 Tax=Pseudomonas sp. RL TaxID=1452718 RepID=UPI0012DD2101|nr:hypothetical protein [Pseudomonas sp. RL]